MRMLSVVVFATLTSLPALEFACDDHDHGPAKGNRATGPELAWIAGEVPGARVVQVLQRIQSERGLPAAITVDHGPEFESKVLDAWAYTTGVRLAFIRPGKPVENAYIDGFNGSFRDECLNEHWFLSTRHARQVIAAWRDEYNTKHPHSSLGYLTPAQFAATRNSRTVAATLPESESETLCKEE